MKIIIASLFKASQYSLQALGFGVPVWPDPKMSSKAPTWKCSLQPSARLPKESLPATLLPIPSGETVTEFFSLQNLEPLDSTSPRGVEKQDDLTNLINGYSRWIMEVTAQDRVAFPVTESNDDLAPRCAIISARRLAQDDMLAWEAFETSLESLTGELETLEFALCLRFEAGIFEESLKSPVSEKSIGLMVA